MSGGFKRSSRFGLVGVFVVAALAAVIGLTTGKGEANPKLALAVIFGVIAIFVVVLLLLQRSDLEHVAGGDAIKSSRAAAEGGRQVEDPTKLEEVDLWAALAIGPIDADAVKARSEVWDVGRWNIKLGAIIFALVLLTVPSIYLLESFVPLLIGGPLIVLAVYLMTIDAPRCFPFLRATGRGAAWSWRWAIGQYRLAFPGWAFPEPW